MQIPFKDSPWQQKHFTVSWAQNSYILLPQTKIQQNYAVHLLGYTLPSFSCQSKNLCRLYLLFICKGLIENKFLQTLPKSKQEDPYRGVGVGNLKDTELHRGLCIIIA